MSGRVRGRPRNPEDPGNITHLQTLTEPRPAGSAVRMALFSRLSNLRFPVTNLPMRCPTMQRFDNSHARQIGIPLAIPKTIIRPPSISHNLPFRAASVSERSQLLSNLQFYVCFKAGLRSPDPTGRAVPAWKLTSSCPASLTHEGSLKGFRIVQTALQTNSRLSA
jgi:hypothetical protein